MLKYLIDVNLPYYFKLWNTDEYIHQLDIDGKATDDFIWKYAIEKKLTIITKDSDFSDRIMLTGPPPKVIHMKLGNTKMKEFHRLINTIWKEVLKLSDENKLVNVFLDKMEGIN